MQRADAPECAASAPWCKLRVRALLRRLYKLTKYFSGQSGAEARSGPLAVAEEGRAKVAAFQEHLPLITAICNPGFRERHWQVSRPRTHAHTRTCYSQTSFAHPAQQVWHLCM